jgi:hypothetical protein
MAPEQGWHVSPAARYRVNYDSEDDWRVYDDEEHKVVAHGLEEPAARGLAQTLNEEDWTFLLVGGMEVGMSRVIVPKPPKTSIASHAVTILVTEAGTSVLWALFRQSPGLLCCCH